MKNKAIIALTAVSLLITFFFVLPIVEYILLIILRLSPQLKFYFYLHVDFQIHSDLSSLIGVLLVPILLIVIIEIGILLLRKTAPNAFRLVLIQYILICSGYLIFEIFYFAFSIVIESISTKFEKSLSLLGITFPYNFFIIIGVIITFFVYLNRVTQKTKQYIN